MIPLHCSPLQPSVKMTSCDLVNKVGNQSQSAWVNQCVLRMEVAVEASATAISAVESEGGLREESIGNDDLHATRK